MDMTPAQERLVSELTLSKMAKIDAIAITKAISELIMEAHGLAPRIVPKAKGKKNDA